MPLAPSLDTVGAIARHVEDLAVVLQALAGPDPRDPAASSAPVPDYSRLLTQDVAGLTVGVDDALLREASADVQKRCEAMLAVLRKIGLKTVSARFPDWTTLDHLGQLVQFPEATAAHAQHLLTRADDYGPQVRARLEYGAAIPSLDYVTALRARGALLAQTLATTFAQADVCLLPVSADFAPTLEELDVAGGPNVQATVGRVMKYTRPLNYLGLPTLVLASPRDGGFPCGLQLVGKPFDEARLLAVGRAYQQVVPPEIAPGIV
jgi:aspartyl-tRNA(Asn)/glutamyl-tRNA(Gln) amidotransferase subunit A